MKILITHQKGGVGKSTVALGFANFFLEQGITPAVIDIDPQGSIATFKAIYEENGIDIFYNLTLEEIDALPNEVKIIDTPPYLYDGVKEFSNSVSFVIVPLKPNLYDAGAIGGTISLLEQNNLLDKTFILLNQVFNGEKREKKTQEVNEDLKKYDATLLKNRFSYSVQWERVTEGLYEPKAKLELENVLAEIMEVTKKKRKQLK